jgi:hypothetical protein
MEAAGSSQTLEIVQRTILRKRALFYTDDGGRFLQNFGNVTWRRIPEKSQYPEFVGRMLLW